MVIHQDMGLWDQGQEWDLVVHVALQGVICHHLSIQDQEWDHLQDMDQEVHHHVQEVLVCLLQTWEDPHLVTSEVHHLTLVHLLPFLLIVQETWFLLIVMYLRGNHMAQFPISHC